MQRLLPRWCCLLLLATLGLLTACGSTPQTRELLRDRAPTASPSRVLLDEVAFFPQQQYQCGPAALATVLDAAGVPVHADELVPMVYVPARQGSLQVEMLAASRQLGRIPYRLRPELGVVLDEVTAGRPVLVMQNLGLDWYPQWHYAVVVGFDLTQRQLVMRSGLEREHRVSLATFERTWARAAHWAVVTLSPGELPVHAEAVDFLDAVLAFDTVQGGNSLPAYKSAHGRWASGLTGMALANALYAEGHSEEAAEVLLELLERDPDYAPAHNNLAHIMLALGRPTLACDHARRAVALTTDGRHTATLQRVQAEYACAL